MTGPVADLSEVDTKFREHEQRRREAKVNQLMSQTTSNLNESMMIGR
jgi:hypothetical protein